MRLFKRRKHDERLLKEKKDEVRALIVSRKKSILNMQHLLDEECVKRDVNEELKNQSESFLALNQKDKSMSDIYYAMQVYEKSSKYLEGAVSLIDIAMRQIEEYEQEIVALGKDGVE